jgi:hypothetical protein
MSAETLWKFYSRLGFGEGAETLFPGESSGRLPHFTDWSSFEQATLSFGYGLSVTPLQLAQAYAVLANDGVKLPASLLKVETVPEGERVMRRSTARSVVQMLEGVVDVEGTAPLAAISGYRVAGKTGTAKKSVSGGYAEDRYLSMFVGLAPASDPRLVMAVLIDEPRGEQYYGGLVAAPVFSKVMGGALRILNIPPDDQPSGPAMLAGIGRVQRWPRRVSKPHPCSRPCWPILHQCHRDWTARSVASAWTAGQWCPVRCFWPVWGAAPMASILPPRRLAAGRWPSPGRPTANLCGAGPMPWRLNSICRCCRFPP